MRSKLIEKIICERFGHLWYKSGKGERVRLRCVLCGHWIQSYLDFTKEYIEKMAKINNELRVKNIKEKYLDKSYDLLVHKRRTLFARKNNRVL